MSLNIHAACIDIKNKGVLFLGASGSGKSDMALRLIAGYQAKLVADDRVDISLIQGKIVASAPVVLKGLLEVRGIGLVKIKPQPQTTIDLVVELTSSGLERMPAAAFYELCGIKLPLVKINPFEISAPDKVLAALSLL